MYASKYRSIRGGPVVRILASHAKGSGSNPGHGNFLMVHALVNIDLSS